MSLGSISECRRIAAFRGIDSRALGFGYIRLHNQIDREKFVLFCIFKYKFENPPFGGHPPFYLIWLHACQLPGPLPCLDRAPFRWLRPCAPARLLCFATCWRLRARERMKGTTRQFTLPASSRTFRPSSKPSGKWRIVMTTPGCSIQAQRCTTSTYPRIETRPGLRGRGKQRWNAKSIQSRTAIMCLPMSSRIIKRRSTTDSTRTSRSTPTWQKQT